MADESKDGALKISSRGELQAWLESLPPEQGRWASTAIASRAALRVACLVAAFRLSWNDQSKIRSLQNETFAIFFAAAIARAAVLYPDCIDKLQSFAESAAKAAISFKDDDDTVGGGVIDSVVQAALTVSYGPASAIDTSCAGFGSASVEHAALAAEHAAAYGTSTNAFLTFAEASHFAGVAVSALIWSATAADISFIAAGGTGKGLATVRLWPLGTPRWVAELMFLLRTALPPHHDWYVWTDWYQSRLDGHDSLRSAELLFATIPAKEREKGPAAANKWIRERLKELHAKDPLPHETAHPAWDFFISASTIDEADARQVVAVLEEAGHSTFAQFKDIAAGNNFVREMQSGLDGSGRMIALYSPEYENSDHCQAEWSAAYNSDPSGKKRKLVPLLLRPTALNSLARQVTYKSLFGLSKEARKAAILNAIAPKPVVPSKLPATIEPIIVDGKIALPATPAEAELDSKTLDAALMALRTQIADLADDLDVEANIDRRVVGFLRRLAQKIPQAPPAQAQLFMLAHEQETLEAYGKTVAKEWPALLAGRYRATTLAFDRTVRQFPEWRLFKQNADKNRLTNQQRAEASKFVADFATALRHEEAAQFVAPEIADTFEEMCWRLDAARDEALQDRVAVGADTMAEDAVTSIENTIKRIAETALAGFDRVSNTATKAGAAYVDSVEEEIVEQAKKVGKKDGAALVKWTKRVIIGTGIVAADAGAKAVGLGAAIARLMDAYPQIGEWLRPVINFLS